MKLSIVVICWNNRAVLEACLHSIFDGIRSTSFEVILTDNGSTDGSVEWTRLHHPAVRIVENRANIGFSRGNNAGIARVSASDYTLILNPDTIVHAGAIDTLIRFADAHPEAGAFGCRVNNPDGSFQDTARPFPDNTLYLKIALRLGRHGYPGWNGTTEREIDWQSGCCLLCRTALLRQLGGFDPRFFYHFEEVDLCYRIRQAGWSIRYTPDATITHLGGNSSSQFPIAFALESYRSRYRYIFKHYGALHARMTRLISLLELHIHRTGYFLRRWRQPSPERTHRMTLFRVAIAWNRRLDPVAFNRSGREPDVDYPPIARWSLADADPAAAITPSR